MDFLASESSAPINPGVHVNVMETLVYEEIDKQLRFYPKNLRNYLNLTEVATYALNRLPPLYASSVKGVEEQRRVAGRQYRSELTSAVRRAIAAVERDPLRNSEPIVSEIEVNYRGAESTLGQIQELLKRYHLLEPVNKEVTWDNCLPLLRQAFLKLTTAQAPPPPGIAERRAVPPPPPPPIRTPSMDDRQIDPKNTLW
ncbi:late competence development ComFB family protein [Synechocystis salina]|uniref:Late competence development ComFB family protein n=1 Tax=Synechocystis salina LEGE 00031 TaxID=1828736 RepID=A0ABR9VVB8_9SYNC|nr:late competence development ComFB family protein [Synechocystis salina]MBE9240908.1 late competence development ComFB family protein [Synechocystis salina LEGE 00041]MBE9254408.1 late competence development ComFB family protein [Synechocystis salina LEGE 00031]